MDLSGRHRAPPESIQIIRTSVVSDKDAIREHSRVFSKVNIKFPKVKPIKRASAPRFKSTFRAARPLLI
jgi:hypothetical protein